MRSLIAKFQTAWDARNACALAPLLADDIVFHTSAAGHPVIGKDQVLSVLDMLSKIVDELAYVSEYTNAEGLVLLSSSRIGGKRADGLQVLTINQEDLITQFQDFVRPLSALTALSAAAAEYMALQDPSG